jgi:hypothetical protein
MTTASGLELAGGEGRDPDGPAESLMPTLDPMPGDSETEGSSISDDFEVTIGTAGPAIDVKDSWAGLSTFVATDGDAGETFGTVTTVENVLRTTVATVEVERRGSVRVRVELVKVTAIGTKGFALGATLGDDGAFGSVAAVVEGTSVAGAGPGDTIVTATDVDVAVPGAVVVVAVGRGGTRITQAGQKLSVTGHQPSQNSYAVPPHEAYPQLVVEEVPHGAKPVIHVSLQLPVRASSLGALAAVSLWRTRNGGVVSIWVPPGNALLRYATRPMRPRVIARRPISA